VNDPNLSTAVSSFTLEGKRVSEIGYRLDDEYEILCRVGLHCAPAAHRSIGTFPEGTVRLAPGPQTTLNEIDATIRAVEGIATS
jgi:selenocysteine lyase/cysteine desulfurase